MTEANAGVRPRGCTTIALTAALLLAACDAPDMSLVPPPESGWPARSSL